LLAAAELVSIERASEPARLEMLAAAELVSIERADTKKVQADRPKIPNSQAPSCILGSERVRCPHATNWWPQVYKPKGPSMIEFREAMDMLGEIVSYGRKLYFVRDVAWNNFVGDHVFTLERVDHAEKRIESRGAAEVAKVVFTAADNCRRAPDSPMFFHGRF